MAKALLGYVGVPDARTLALAAEVRRLRLRVAELTEQLDQACRANSELHRAMAPLVLDDHTLLTLEGETALEPALT